MNTITENTKLTDLLDYALELKQYKADYVQPAGEFKFLPDGTLTNKTDATGLFAGTNMAPGKLTEHALDQAFEKLGLAYQLDGKNLSSLKSPHMLALAQADPALFAIVMNAAIERLPEKSGWTVRTFENTVRAVLSKGYLIIDNNEMLDMLQNVLKEQGAPHRISTRSFVNADNMSVDILFDEIHFNGDAGTGNGSFGIGVRVKNGETGKWKGGVYPIVKRRSCDNSITTDDRTHCFEFRHSGQNTAASKRVLLEAAIGEILPFTADIVNRLIESEAKQLPRFTDIVNGLAIKHGWSQEITGTVFAGSEAKFSVAGLVNGLTYAAHKAPVNEEARVELETMGGNLLFDRTDSTIKEALSMYDTRQVREERAEAKRLAKLAKLNG